MEHQPLQGPGRDERGTIVGNDTQSRHPPPAAGPAGHDGLSPDRKPDHQIDGQGRSGRPSRADGTARRCRGNRRINPNPALRMIAVNFAASKPDRTTSRVRLRPTMTSDLEYVLSLEQDPENLPFIAPWERTQHEAAIRFPDFRHFIVEGGAGLNAVGFLILIGCRSQNQSIELK